uniref:Uncharacterized protein n=1 Tax=Rhipicephalus appendiculatus TaxID=34631 RepID=A0A131YCV5_RHIAP
MSHGQLLYIYRVPKQKFKDIQGLSRTCHRFFKDLKVACKVETFLLNKTYRHLFFLCIISKDAKNRNHIENKKRRAHKKCRSF